MIKIFTYGASAMSNFGGPSILFGVHRIWSKVFDECDIVHYDCLPKESSEEERPFAPNRIVHYQLHPQIILIGAFLYKIFGKNFLRNANAVLLDEVISADIVVDLWGIMFSDKAGTKKADTPLLRRITHRYTACPLLLAAKILGKTVVKYTASFGPIRTDLTRARALFSMGRVADLVLCREHESKKVLSSIGVSENHLLVTPDSALMMEKKEADWQIPFKDNRPIVGISVSHQIARRWSAEESYLAIIVSFVQHAVAELGVNVLLIPNELHEKDLDDYDWCERILNATDAAGRCVVLQTAGYTAQELKWIVSKCDAMLASRYHSVVACMSLCVPTLALGWHYKYNELMELYGQGEYVITSEGVSSERVISDFTALWGVREECHRTMLGNHKEVETKIKDSEKRFAALLGC